MGDSNAKEKNRLQPKPNIVFIFADDWGYGDLGCYGNKEVQTPNLDKLARQGTRFTQFYVTSGVCSPSRSSVITGQFPAVNKIHGHFAGNELNKKRDMPNWLPTNLPVYLPKLMQEAGYYTAHFGKWHLGGGGKPHGDPDAPEPKKYGYNETRVWNGNGPTWKGDKHWPNTRYMDDDTVWIQNSSKIVVDETIALLKSKKSDKPLFINLWLKDPHTPLAPSEKQMKPFTNKGLERDMEIYYSVLKDADYHIGRLLKALSQLGLDNNTLVIFSSDNGPANYAPARIAGSTAGLKGRKTDLFNGGVNVPCIMRWPGRLPAYKVDSTTVLSLVDFLPTFAELTKKKLSDNHQFDGESFAKIFDNEVFKRTKALYWEWKFPYQGNDIFRQNSWVSSAIMDANWKLLADEARGRIELYDIPNDPYERNNLVETHPEKAKELLNKWNEWKIKLPR
nr:sulfatase-like hydrolase/transferase [Pedobacter glucosidilyticus]